jgi:hypothetical protein
LGYHMPEMPHCPTPIGKDIQDRGYGLPRIYLPRTPLNKGKKKGGSPDPYSAGRYLHRQGHIHLVILSKPPDLGRSRVWLNS